MTKGLILTGVLVAILCAVPAAAEDCVGIKLGAEIVPGTHGEVLSLYFQGGNCGSEPGLAMFTATAAQDGVVAGSAKFSVRVPAGVPIKRGVDIPLPPGTPPGCYTLCLEVQLGTAYDVTCATVTVGRECELLGFYPHESTPGGVSTWSWGEVKAEYK
jgi:hypothetical protein